MCLLSTEMDTEPSPGSAWTLQRALDTEERVYPPRTPLIISISLNSGGCWNRPADQIYEWGDRLSHVYVLGAGRGRGCIWVQVEAQAEAGAAWGWNGVVRQSKARQERAAWGTWGARQRVSSCGSTRKSCSGVDDTGR